MVLLARGCLAAGWSEYKYRFLPWIAVNLRKELREGRQHECVRNDEHYLGRLQSLLRAFTRPDDDPWLLYRDTRRRRHLFASLHDDNRRVMLREFGFSVRVRASRIAGAGNGVFVDEGRVREGQIVALYPGTQYEPYQPLLLQSIRNKYILRCADGVSLDANTRGISKSVYTSAHARDRVDGAYPLCDLSWIADGSKKAPVCPLNVGHIVNNASCEVGQGSANVTYHEIDVWLDGSDSFDPRLRLFLPNAHYAGGETRRLRLVPLIALKNIEEGEELLSSYFSMVR